MVKHLMPSLAPACSGPEIPILCTPGSNTITIRVLLVCAPINTAVTARGAFSNDLQLKQQMEERLHQGPGPQAQQQAAPHADGPPPSRWTLETIRVSFDWLANYTLSGVWRALQRLDLRLRSAVVQQYSPDPEYTTKLLDLEMALWEAHRYPRSVAAIFLDEMGFSRWPDPGPDWSGLPPVADRRGANNGLWRLIGGLNALTGQVTYLDNYIVGRAKVAEFYGQLVEVYPKARRLYVIQDNWSIHKHPEVLEALKAWPQVEPVWLPTYAPWLNPIEKLWRWLRQSVLKMHRLADNWIMLRGRVRSFLEQFTHGSQRLLEYVGLLGDGLIARMIHGP
jgi:DDE superfamily endonuclease